MASSLGRDMQAALGKWLNKNTASINNALRNIRGEGTSGRRGSLLT